MKAKTLILFYDKKEKVDRQPGDTFECTEARFQEILAASEPPLVEKVETRKRTTKKTDTKVEEPAEATDAEE